MGKVGSAKNQVAYEGEVWSGVYQKSDPGRWSIAISGGRFPIPSAVWSGGGPPHRKGPKG